MRRNISHDVIGKQQSATIANIFPVLVPLPAFVLITAPGRYDICLSFLCVNSRSRSLVTTPVRIECFSFYSYLVII